MFALLALAWLAAAVPAHSALTAVTPEIARQAPAEQVWTALTHAFGEAGGRPAKDVLASVNAIIASPTFKQLDTKRRETALLQAGMLAIKAEEPAEAVRLTAAATEIDSSNEALWAIRFQVARKLKSPDAVAALAGMAARSQFLLREVEDSAVADVARAAHQGADPNELRLLDALYAARWRPADSLDDPSYLWRDLALLLVKAGQYDRAVVVTREITNPYVMISVRADRRFDALVARAPDQFDVQRVADAQLQDLQARAAEPDRLEIVNGVVVDLLKRGKVAEALALADEIIARIADPARAAGLVDLQSEKPWTLSYRARALAQLGRADESLNQMRLAVSASRDGDPLQPINLADQLYESGKPDEALASMPTQSGLEPAAQMEVEEIRVCAYIQKGARHEADASLPYLYAHEDDNLDALEVSLLCENDQEALANVYIRRLRDEATRADMLLILQDYMIIPGQPAFMKILQERRQAVLRRPDVAAAIHAVGRTERWPFEADRY